MIFAFDLDGVICQFKTEGETYADVQPFPEAVQVLQSLKNEGHTIILYTARHMKTCNGNSGKILAKQGKILFDWLAKYNIPYDELWWSKPYADLTIDDSVHKHMDWQTTADAIAKRISDGPRTA